MTEEKVPTYEETAAGYDAKYAALNAGLPEAGGIAYCTMYSKTGIAVNITGRGVNPLRAIEGLIEAIVIAEKRWQLTADKNLPAASAPAVPAPVKIAQEEGNAALAAEMQATITAIPEPPAGKAWITFDADIVQVLPQPDNKVSLQFFAAGKQYPGVKVNKWQTDSVQGLMKYVTAEDMSKAAEYRLRCRVYYTEGKEGKTQDGKTFHYKDVAHVRPL